MILTLKIETATSSEILLIISITKGHYNPENHNIKKQVALLILFYTLQK